MKTMTQYNLETLDRAVKNNLQVIVTKDKLACRGKHFWYSVSIIKDGRTILGFGSADAQDDAIIRAIELSNR